MYCISCGAENLEEAIFCQKCGKQLKTTTDHDEPIRKNAPNQHVQKKFNNTKLLIVLGIALLFVIIIVAVAVVYTSTQNNNTSNNTSSNTSASGNTQSNADPRQIQPLLQQFCQDVVNGNYQDAYGLLSQK